MINEAINHFVERGGKIFACFLDVRKAFDTVWIDCLMHKLLSELGVQRKMFSAIKPLYSDIQRYLYFIGTTTDLFPVTQGSGQGRVPAAFVYKVYINQLIKEISECRFSLTINDLQLGCPTFADNMTLLAVFPSFLKNLMEKAFLHSKLWRYEYNEIKSGETFGKTGPQHFVQKHKRSWTLGEKVVEEDDQYKNLGVVKNYVGSFQFDIHEAIEKTRKKAGMILNGCTDHKKKTNPAIYVKLWKQVCLPSLLFGSELWIISQSQLTALERCQRWFLQKYSIYQNLQMALF